MTRQNATNFSGALQFPYATAATDSFKKEDVQTLAQAVDQHTHGTIKELALDVSTAIPAGSITSGMIADGTITTADLAANATWAMLNQYTATPTFSTTTTGAAVNTPITVSFTTTTGLVCVSLSSPFNHSVVGGTWFLGLAFDGGAATNLAVGISPIAGLSVALSFIYYAALTPGAHTVVVTAVQRATRHDDKLQGPRCICCTCRSTVDERRGGCERTGDCAGRLASGHGCRRRSRAERFDDRRSIGRYPGVSAAAAWRATSAMRGRLDAVHL